MNVKLLANVCSKSGRDAMGKNPPRGTRASQLVHHVTGWCILTPRRTSYGDANAPKTEKLRPSAAGADRPNGSVAAQPADSTSAKPLCRRP